MIKFIKKFLRWIYNIFRNESDIVISQKTDFYTYEYVIDLPDELSLNKIFIVKDGFLPELLAMQCPCGCNEKIFLNLLEDATPLWKFNFTNDGNINVHPSVWRNLGCKSHFFIRNGKIDWVA